MLIIIFFVFSFSDGQHKVASNKIILYRDSSHYPIVCNLINDEFSEIAQGDNQVVFVNFI